MLQHLLGRPQNLADHRRCRLIGSNLLERLLLLDQHVIGLDKFATSQQRNLAEVKGIVSDGQWARFRFGEGRYHGCAKATKLPCIQIQCR